MTSQQQPHLAMCSQVEQTIPSWERIFLTYPIFDRICTYLQPRELVRLRSTTKKLSSSFESLFKTQWNINRSLMRFVYNPVAFRSTLSRQNAIISGSFALQFFDRVVWDGSDLDIYVEDGPGVEELEEYLTKSEDYELQKQKPGADMYHAVLGFADVYTSSRYFERTLGLTPVYRSRHIFERTRTRGRPKSS